MKLITWNVQWGRGVDQCVDLKRIIDDSRALADFDVLCLQEIAAGFPDLEGHDGSDQFAAIASQLPGFAAIPHACVDLPGPEGRQLFGNMVLSRLPVGQIVRHALPFDGGGVKSMARGCLEVVVEASFGPVRVMTTHLEANSPDLRAAQVEALRDIQRRGARRAAAPARSGHGPYRTGAGAGEAILTGDFNMTADAPAIARLIAPIAEAPAFCDSWAIRHGAAPRPVSMNLFDRSEGPARSLDFIFVTEGLAPRVRRVVFDQASRASDHQPVLVELA